MSTEKIERVLALKEIEKTRPGVTAISDEIRDAHPEWSTQQVMTETKNQWFKRQPERFKPRDKSKGKLP